MAFQSSVNVFNTLGFVGELAFDGPMRVAPYNLNSSGTDQYIGYAYTVTANGNPDPTAGSPLAGTAKVGGTGVFAGILVSPKEYASFGTSGAPLDPTLILPDDSIGNLLTMGQIFVSLSNTTANVGDLVYFSQTTGQLTSMAPTASFTGSIAAGGSAGVQDTLTVSAITAGKLGVGSIIASAGTLAGTYITALGTGTGGTGTYKVSTINLQTVSSEAMTANSVAPSGSTLVPNCVVARYGVTGNLAAIKLTN